MAVGTGPQGSDYQTRGGAGSADRAVRGRARKGRGERENWVRGGATARGGTLTSEETG